MGEALDKVVVRCKVIESGLEFTQADIDEMIRAYRTAEQIAADTGLSKVTIQRYLNYLIGTNEAESRVDYSTGG